MDDALLFRYFRGETTPAEERTIDKWLRADPEAHGRQYDSALFIYEASVVHGRTPGAKMIPLRRVIRWVSGAAAAVLLVAGAGLIFQQQYYARQTTTVEAPAGQHIRFALADGSVINLNSGATLTHPAVFTGRQRRVKLSGEAMFDVKPDTKKPFVVETFACEVTVLGTRFNVIADEEECEFSTALFEGRVAVSSLDGTSRVILEPDMMASLSGGRLMTSHIGNMDAYLWPEGIISVGGLPFDRLMEKLENAYGVRMVLERETPPTIYYTNLKVRVSDGIEHALDLLSDVSDFSYEYNTSENTVVIK